MAAVGRCWDKSSLPAGSWVASPTQQTKRCLPCRAMPPLLQGHDLEHSGPTRISLLQALACLPVGAPSASTCKCRGHVLPHRVQAAGEKQTGHGRGSRPNASRPGPASPRHRRRGPSVPLSHRSLLPGWARSAPLTRACKLQPIQ